MATLKETIDLYSANGMPWVKGVIKFPGDPKVNEVICVGSKGIKAKLVQEMLYLRKQTRCGVDGEFGPGTELAVKAAQTLAGLPVTGVVNAATWEFMVGPLLKALEIPSTKGVLSATVAQVAMQHDAAVEFGGANSGPWVRLYCQGHQGTPYAWCAGFVSFVLAQAAMASGNKSPLTYTLGCDQLAQEAKRLKRFVSQPGLGDMAAKAPHVFLVRKTGTDWIHTGFGLTFTRSAFSTCEGNSNETGSREGVAVVQLSRSYNNRDFIRID